MKKFFISFVLIISLLFNVFADNKQAHKELREAFENWEKLPIMVEKGFDLDKLDKIDDWKEMRDYLQPFFLDEKGYPLDQHSPIHFYDNKENYLGFVDVQCQMYIDWSDEYGSKDELLKEGYKEDEIFYYPYFNGEWKDGYRVGKKFRCTKMGSYSGYGNGDIVSTKKSLFLEIGTFEGVSPHLDVISKSSKKYLILDLSENGGGSDRNYYPLVDAIKK